MYKALKAIHRIAEHSEVSYLRKGQPLKMEEVSIEIDITKETYGHVFDFIK